MLLLDRTIDIKVLTEMHECPSWMASEAMDEDNAARSQNTLRLRCGESERAALQIAIILTIASPAESRVAGELPS